MSLLPDRTSPKPADLPRVLAVLDIIDGGPCTDGFGTAQCPHCGAEGRWVIKFLCDDGTVRGAMQGCFNLFRGAESRTAKLVREAFERVRGAAEAKTKAASWWLDMVAEAHEFGRSGGVEHGGEFEARIAEIEARRQAWLVRNGYGRGGRRRR